MKEKLKQPFVNIVKALNPVKSWPWLAIRLDTNQNQHSQKITHSVEKNPVVYISNQDFQLPIIFHSK